MRLHVMPIAAARGERDAGGTKVQSPFAGRVANADRGVLGTQFG